MNAQQGSVEEQEPQNDLHRGTADRARGGPIWRAVARALNARAPINSLPPELLCLIFNLVDGTALFCLPAHVCSHWRATALAEPCLWTRIHITYWHALEAIPVLLERSGDAPVDMELSLGGKRFGVLGTTPQPADASLFVDDCAQAIAAHIGHILRLTVFAHTSVVFAAVVGLASQRPSSNLRHFNMHINLRCIDTPPLNLCGFRALRTLVTNTHPEAGDWMCRLESMKLDYDISVEQIFALLVCTRSLESLHLRGNVRGDPLRPETIDPRLKQLRLRRLICEHIDRWVPLLADILPLTGAETLITVPVGPFGIAAPHLLGGTDKITALALEESIRERRIALADARGRRRMFSTLDGRHALLSMRDHLPDVERLTVLANHSLGLRSIQWDLGGVSLARLRTIIWELEDFVLASAASGDCRDALPVRRAIDTMGWPLVLRLPTALPVLRDIVLIPKPKTLCATKTVISAVAALVIVEHILADPAAPRPRLRLVYLRLATDEDERERGARQKLEEKVACILEECWDRSTCQSWYGMPEYALGREIVMRR